MASKRAATSQAVRNEDAERTVANWKSLDITSLRLKCNQYSLVEKGNKDTVASRLFDHFEEHRARVQDNERRPERSPSVSSVSTVSSASSTSSESEEEEEERHDITLDDDEILDLETGDKNQLLRDNDQNKNSNHNGGQSTHNNNRTRTPSTHNGGNNNNNNGSNDEILLEIRALRSELKNVKDKQSELDGVVKNNNPNTNVNRKRANKSQQNHAPPKRSKQNPADAHNNPRHNVNVNRHHVPNNRNQNQHIRTQPNTQIRTDTQQRLTRLANPQTTTDFVVTSPQSNDQNPPPLMQVNPGMTRYDSYQNPWDYFRNPFLPPGCPEVQLKKIEERQYVDFQNLLPENNSVETGGETPAIDIEPSGYLKQNKENKSTKKVKVNSFQRWSSAWCIFAQAHLHYHPADYYGMFMYHSNFVNNVSKFRLEACLRYDSNFRLLMANQRRLPPDQQTCHWQTMNEDLRVRYLSENGLTFCDHCKAPGHYSSACRIKLDEKAKELPQQLAAAFKQHNVTLQPLSSAPPTNSASPKFNQWLKPNNFRSPRTNQPHTPADQTPPHKKHCWRFNNGSNCAKPPCQFLHACEKCGRRNHGTHNCHARTSTNFIPNTQPTSFEEEE
jgi:hypothetical protein